MRNTVTDPLTTAEETLPFLSGRQIDLVLMDIELAYPMNGIRTTGILHQTSGILIVLATGFSQISFLNRPEPPSLMFSQQTSVRIETGGYPEKPLHRDIFNLKPKEPPDNP